MTVCELDHIVVAAASLDDGARFIRERLGVDIPPGGRHELMGTHNRLMRLGRDSYLEVIAIDPLAPPPSRTRWYGLDDPAMRERLRRSGPQLITWVARTSDIVAAVQSSTVPLGAIVPVSRGHLSWRLTVPSDGHLPGGGLIPHLIEWDGGVRPWEAMADLGCDLEELTLFSPDPDSLVEGLKTLCGSHFPKIRVETGEVPALVAKIATLSGLATI